MAYRILMEFSQKIAKSPGSHATQITYYLAVDTRAWLRKHVVLRVYEDYTNLFEMSNGHVPQIGLIEDTWFRSWSESRAFDEFWALQDRAEREGSLL